MTRPNNRLLRLVAIFKLLKAVALIVTGIGILKLMHADLATQLTHWAARLGFDPGSRYITHALEKVTNVSPNKIRDLGIVSFIYAGLFLTEGIGLWLEKRWAEWFTTIITGSLVPIEVYEIYRHPSAIKVVVLLLNIAIVIYLIYRIRKDSQKP